MSSKIRIKFSGRVRPNQNPAYWTALFPNQVPEIGKCVFSFDPDDQHYDWLVVYEDLMYPENHGKSTRRESLACPRQHTLIITQEPETIKIYGPGFLSQYGHVLNAQPSNFVAHPNHILQVSPIRWFYGRPLDKTDHNYTTVDTMRSRGIPEKTSNISTVCSDKQMTKVLKQRYDFTAFLKDNLGDDFDWFGRGIRPVNDKSEAMDSYRYHIGIENHLSPHYWTDKISDSFLAYCLPFYYGPENITEYFDRDSFIPIDIYKPKAALEIVKKALKDRQFEARIEAIKAARELVLTDYNLVNIAARIVTERHDPTLKIRSSEEVLGRHAFRQKHPLLAAKDLAFRAKMRI